MVFFAAFPGFEKKPVGSRSLEALLPWPRPGARTVPRLQRGGAAGPECAQHAPARFSASSSRRKAAISPRFPRAQTPAPGAAALPSLRGGGGIQKVLDVRTLFRVLVASLHPLLGAGGSPPGCSSMAALGSAAFSELGRAVAARLVFGLCSFLNFPSAGRGQSSLPKDMEGWLGPSPALQPDWARC